MATTLTKQAREAFVLSALKDAFIPRFSEFGNKLNEYVKKAVQEEHPDFLRAYADEKTRPYLAVGSILYIKIKNADLKVPNYEAIVDADYMARRRHSNTPGTDGMRAHVISPAYGKLKGEELNDAALVAEYNRLWADFFEAQSTLINTITAYRSREKFEADFPQLAKYLPAHVVTSGSTAVAIPAKDVMAKLLAAGVPPAVAEV